VEIHRLDHRLPAAGEIKQIMGYFPGPVHLPDDLAEAILDFL
jgi:hypothetical protein